MLSLVHIQSLSKAQSSTVNEALRWNCSALSISFVHSLPFCCAVVVDGSSFPTEFFHAAITRNKMDSQCYEMSRDFPEASGQHQKSRSACCHLCYFYFSGIGGDYRLLTDRFIQNGKYFLLCTVMGSFTLAVISSEIANSYLGGRFFYSLVLYCHWIIAFRWMDQVWLMYFLLCFLWKKKRNDKSTRLIFKLDCIKCS